MIITLTLLSSVLFTPLAVLHARQPRGVDFSLRAFFASAPIQVPQSTTVWFAIIDSDWWSMKLRYEAYLVRESFEMNQQQIKRLS